MRSDVRAFAEACAAAGLQFGSTQELRDQRLVLGMGRCLRGCRRSGHGSGLGGSIGWTVLDLRSSVEAAKGAMHFRGSSRLIDTSAQLSLQAQYLRKVWYRRLISEKAV